MKKHHSMVWNLCALAVVASPLTLDHVWSHMQHSFISRSIASEELAEPVAVAAADAAKSVVHGPVDEKVAPRDMAAFNRFVAANQAAVNAVTSPFAVVLGESSAQTFARHEEASVGVLQELRTINDSITQLRGSANRDSNSGELRSQLVTQVGRLLRLEQDFSGISALPAAREAASTQLDLSSSTLPAVKSFADEVIASLEQLDARIAELKAQPVTPTAVAVSQTAAPASELSSEQRSRIERADRIIADQERREREERARECRATKTPPVVTSQVEQMNLMLMAMIGQNQTMLSMLMLQMRQSMLGPYFSQGSWPSQSYAGTGLSLSYGQFLPGQVNPYSQYADQLNGINQLGAQAPLLSPPSFQAQLLPLNNSFNFGGELPTAQFNNFQPFNGPQLASI